MVSQKCKYALRAIFELAKRYGRGPVRIGDIARTQAIPSRFLEVILTQLKQGGFVESRRGSQGGYLLARQPSSINVGEVIGFVEGPFGPVSCVAGEGGTSCPIHEHCVFVPMWQKVKDAVSKVYNGTTFQSLLDEEVRMRSEYVPTYAI